MLNSYMTAAQEQHLGRIIDRFAGDVSDKYRAGQREHGGDLFLKPRMLPMAIEEALDLPVYLFTLDEQLTELMLDMRAAGQHVFADRLFAIINPDQERV